MYNQGRWGNGTTNNLLNKIITVVTIVSHETTNPCWADSMLPRILFEWQVEFFFIWLLVVKSERQADETTSVTLIGCGVRGATQGLVKGYPYFYFRHGESTSTASQLTFLASQKSKDLNKVLLLYKTLSVPVQCTILVCCMLLINKWIKNHTVNFIYILKI